MKSLQISRVIPLIPSLSSALGNHLFTHSFFLLASLYFAAVPSLFCFFLLCYYFSLLWLAPKSQLPSSSCVSWVCIFVSLLLPDFLSLLLILSLFPLLFPLSSFSPTYSLSVSFFPLIKVAHYCHTHCVNVTTQSDITGINKLFPEISAVMLSDQFAYCGCVMSAVWFRLYVWEGDVLPHCNTLLHAQKRAATIRHQTVRPRAPDTHVSPMSSWEESRALKAIKSQACKKERGTERVVRKCRQCVTWDVVLKGPSCQCRGPVRKAGCQAACLFLHADMVAGWLTCGHTLSDRCRPADGQKDGQIK